MTPRLSLISLLLLAVACGGGSSTPPVAAAPETEVAPVQVAASKPSAAAARADALIAELQAKEAAYKQDASAIAERDRQSAMPASAPERVAPAPGISPTVPVTAATAPQSGTVSAPTAELAGGHDEAWWKNEMRMLDTRLENDLRQFNAALAAWKGAIESMNTKSVALAASAQDAALVSERETQRLKAVVQNDRDAIERLREDARRASVPPGWLRWP